MNLLQRLGAYLRVDNQRGSGWSMVTGNQPTAFQQNGRNVRQMGWETNGVVQGCVRAIVDVLAAVDYEVCRVQSDGFLKVIPNHEAADLLNLEPRAGMNGLTLRALTGVYYLLYGNAFWAAERGARQRITGLRLVHPERIAYAYLNSDDNVVKWDWRDLQGVPHQSPADDMLHLRDLSAGPQSLFGFPRAAASLTDMATDAEATAYVRQVVTNHGNPAAIVMGKGFTSKEEMLKAEDSFNDRLTGRGRRGRTLFMNGEELTYTPVGFNLTQLEFPDLRGISRESICTSFGVDPRMVGIGSAQSSGGGFSGIEFKEARFKLIQQAVLPVMKAIEAELNRWYMPEFGKGVIRFRADALSELTEDEGQTSTRVIAEVLAGITTVEEARETIGRTADMDPEHHFGGGNKTQVKVALEQAALDPVAKAKAMQEVVPNAPLPGRENGPALGPGKATAPKQLTAGATPPNTSGGNGAGAKANPTRGLGPGAIVHRADRLTPADRASLWRAFIERTDKEEPGVVATLHRLFAADWDTLIQLFAVGSILDAATTALLLRSLALRYEAQGDLYRTWLGSLSPIIEDLVQSGIEDEIAAGRAPASLATSARARALIRTRTDTLVRQVHGTSFDQMRGLILVGRASGQSPREVADLIARTVFGPAADQRAELIARTEVAAAIHQGGFLAAMVGHTVQRKQWISQRDDRVRPSHVAAEEQGWIPVEQAFNNGLQFPGDPHGGADDVCGCRCAIAYTTETM